MSRGTEKRVRAKHLTIRFSDEEREQIDQMSDRAGLTAGSFARRAILGAEPPRQVRRPPVERRELARLLGELGKVGSNINQLARAHNSGLLVYESEIDVALRGLDELRIAILKALGRDP